MNVTALNPAFSSAKFGHAAAPSYKPVIRREGETIVKQVARYAEGSFAAFLTKILGENTVRNAMGLWDVASKMFQRATFNAPEKLTQALKAAEEQLAKLAEGTDPAQLNAQIASLAEKIKKAEAGSWLGRLGKVLKAPAVYQDAAFTAATGFGTALSATHAIKTLLGFSDGLVGSIGRGGKFLLGLVGLVK